MGRLGEDRTERGELSSGESAAEANRILLTLQLVLHTEKGVTAQMTVIKEPASAMAKRHARPMITIQQNSKTAAGNSTEMMDQAQDIGPGL